MLLNFISVNSCEMDVNSYKERNFLIRLINGVFFDRFYNVIFNMRAHEITSSPAVWGYVILEINDYFLN